VPVGFSAPGPGLVYYHGGGWTLGDLDTHDQTCRFLAQRSGVTVISVDYRLAPEHPFPAPVDDAIAAFGDIHAHAADHDIDPGRIAVGGDSAGGQLSAVVSLVTTREGGAAPAFQLLIYPAVDGTREWPSYALFGEGYFLTQGNMRWYWDNFAPEGVDRSDPRLSPLLADDLTGLPPAYVATAGFDALRDEGEAYAARLREAGVAVTLRRHPGLVHGFVNMVGKGTIGSLATAEAAGALQVALAPAAAKPKPKRRRPAAAKSTAAKSG
jgi:acetyl esterase